MTAQCPHCLDGTCTDAGHLDANRRARESVGRVLAATASAAPPPKTTPPNVRPYRQASAAGADERTFVEAQRRTTQRQIGWHGASGALYGLDERPQDHEPGSFAPMWITVHSDLIETADDPRLPPVEVDVRPTYPLDPAAASTLAQVGWMTEAGDLVALDSAMAADQVAPVWLAVGVECAVAGELATPAPV